MTAEWIARRKEAYKIYRPWFKSIFVEGPEGIYLRTVKELEDLGYDIKGFERSFEAYNQFWREITLQIQPLVVKRVSPEEYYKHLAPLFRDYVTKHLKPLPMEEWKLRQKQYANEAAERQRKQQGGLGK